MEQVLTFIADYWLVCLLGLIAVSILVALTRMVVKLIVVGVFVVGILILGFNYTPEDILEAGEKLLSPAEEIASEIQKKAEKEIKEADVTVKKDGTYELSTASLSIIGKKGSSKATVVYKGKEYSMDISFLQEKLEDAVDQAKKQKEVKA